MTTKATGQGQKIIAPVFLAYKNVLTETKHDNQ